MEDLNAFKNELAELLIYHFPELRGKGRHLFSVEIQVGRSTAEVSNLSIAMLDMSGKTSTRIAAEPSNDRGVH